MDSPAVQKRLKLAILLTFFVLCVEAAGGILANSLALLGDAAHMLADVFSLSLSWLALKIAHRPSTQDKTYGYHRLETLAALVNGVLLLLMAGGILYEAIERFQAPPGVNSLMVMAVAAIGLATNCGVIYFLRHPFHGTQDLNIKSAFYHVIGDLAASLGVLIGAIVIWFTGWHIVDPILAGGIACLLLWGAKKVISDSVHILLEGVPKGVSIKEVQKELTAIPDIKDVHELHIWSICSNVIALSTHALISDQKVNQAESILSDVQNVLEEKFNITHSTIQFESNPCREAKAVCDIRH